MSDFTSRGGGFASAPALRFHGRTPDMPITGAQATTMTGVTLTSLYLCRETSGSLVDTMGGNSLAVTNTPMYAVPLGPDRTGIRYASAVTLHSADVNALALASWWYAGIFATSVAGLGLVIGLVSRFTAAAVGAGIYHQITGAASLLVSDGIAAPLALTDSVSLDFDSLYLCQMQIDRASTTARARFSPICRP